MLPPTPTFVSVSAPDWSETNQKSYRMQNVGSLNVLHRYENPPTASIFARASEAIVDIPLIPLFVDDYPGVGTFRAGFSLAAGLLSTCLSASAIFVVVAVDPPQQGCPPGMRRILFGFATIPS